MPTKELNYLTTLPLLVQSNVQLVHPTKDIPSSPCLVGALEHSRSCKAPNLHLLDHPFPCCLGVDDEFIPNTVFDLRLMSLFMAKHLVVAFIPNGPKRNTAKKVPNFDLFAKFLTNPSPKQSLFPMEAIKVADSNPTKLIHDECGPSPSPPNLNAIPNFMFDRFAHIWEAKKHIVWIWRRVQCEPFIH